jgi:murein DD-endopeptidase MepM/ murein hydrolase activator NlpD
LAKREIWTVQFFPESGGRARSFRLRPSVAYLAGGVCAGFLLLVLAWFLGFLGERQAIYQLSRYEAENQHLVASLAAIENRTDRLAQALDDLAAREQRFRVLSGLPLLDEELYAVGIGGPTLNGEAGGPFDALAPELASTSRSLTMDLDQLLRRAELLSSSLAEATDSVAAQQDLFGRRPTIYPVLDERSWISSGFSYNRLHPLLGYRRPHPGIDVSASYGSPVVATGEGRVVFAGRETGYGRLVEIEHGYGYRTRYAHLSRATVRVGQQVQRGDIVGEVGRSGLTTGPNLHYEVLVNDRPVNPRAYILDDAFQR